MSSPSNKTARSTGDSDSDSRSRTATSGDISNPTYQVKGDSADWKSWPIDGPGPFVPQARMQEVMRSFQRHNEMRDEQSRTEEKVLHLAEFSSSGDEIFSGHVTEPELATLLENPHPESRLRLLFPSTQRSTKAVYSTYTQRILSSCGAPAAVWDTFYQESTSPLHSFIDSHDGNTVFHGWMTLRFQWKTSRDALHLLSGPLLDFFQQSLMKASNTFYPNIYFSYNDKTQRTTIMTTDLVLSHLFMIQHVKESCGMSIRPEEVPRLLIQYFVVVQECFRAIAHQWDEKANGPAMASRTLDDSADHAALVRVAEQSARLADMIRGDFMAFKSALTSLEEYLQSFCRILNLDPAIRDSLGALFMEQRKHCEVTSFLFDNIVSRYDRFLTLLLNYTNIRMVEGMKSVSEQNAKTTEEMKELARQNGDMTADMKELAVKNAHTTTTMADLMRQNAEATTQMKISTQQNAEATNRMKELAELNHRITAQSAEATTRMAELAEVNRQQALQSARQSHSMAVLAYDAKRDSEVMKAITVVTLIFLPATSVSTVFSMGFFNIDYDQIQVSRQGWIYLACTLPLTLAVLVVAFAWIIWTGKKEQKPVELSAGEVLAQAADTLRLGAGHKREGV